MKVVIVIPTFNEAENIKLLIPVLQNEFKGIPHDCHVLVVDGNSPDGTGEVVQSFERQFDNIHHLPEKEKAGLGAAYTYGFKHAMNELGADVIIEMDADFQHDPKDVKRLVAEIDSGADYVIGSRFISGGGIPKEWALYRKLLSFGGSLFTKVVLWIWDIKDFTSGFKASRVKGFVDQIDLDNILSKGFAYKIELLYKMYKLGANVKEIPIQFGLRDRGDSKMEQNNMVDSMRVVLTIRYKENKSFFRFVAVGFAGLFTDLTLFNIFSIGFKSIFTTVALAYKYASLSSGFLAMMVTYTLNNIWSFGHNKKTDLLDNIKSFVLFSVSSYIPIVVRSYLIKFGTIYIADTFIVRNTMFFIGIAIGLVWNFTVYSRIIWKDRPEKSE